jgi:disulfide bond formation protein DsbB
MMTLIANHRLMLLMLAVIAAAALGMAYTAQYGFGLAPCVLCLYQRVPYAAVIALGLIGYALNKYPHIFLGLIGSAFAINTLIAAYHTGVERKWWRSFLEGCSSPDLSGSIDDLMKRIEAAPVTACDAIPWVDPVLGLSMANYNVIFCAILAALAASSLCRK